MPANDKILTECAQKFCNNDPQVYEHFLRTLDQRVTDYLVAMSNAPTADILVAQGRCQEARKMFDLMTAFMQKSAATTTKSSP